eukprot:3941365-Rhodomonas_salina.6
MRAGLATFLRSSFPNSGVTPPSQSRLPLTPPSLSETPSSASLSSRDTFQPSNTVSVAVSELVSVWCSRSHSSLFASSLIQQAGLEDKGKVVKELVGEAVEYSVALGARVKERQRLLVGKLRVDQLRRGLGPDQRDHVPLARLRLLCAHCLVLLLRDLHRDVLEVAPVGVGGVDVHGAPHPHQHPWAAICAAPVTPVAQVGSLRGAGGRWVSALLACVDPELPPVAELIKDLAEHPQLRG